MKRKGRQGGQWLTTMGNNFTEQMTDHILDPVRGPQVGHRLEYYAPAAVGQEWTRGSVISANDLGQLRKGCPQGSGYNRPMPMVALQGTDDLDVWYDNANPTVNGTGAPAGVPSALVCTGGFELASSEFEKTSDGTTPVIYNVNDQLTCDANGKLIKKTADTEPTVGIVSIARSALTKVNAIGVRLKRYNTDLLTFWTVFIPATGNEGSN